MLVSFHNESIILCRSEKINIAINIKNDNLVRETQVINNLTVNKKLNNQKHNLEDTLKSQLHGKMDEKSVNLSLSLFYFCVFSSA